MTLTSRKLGRTRPKAPPLALRLRHYLPRLATAQPPAVVDLTAKASASLAQVYGNDTEGDCVIADRMHAVGVWTGNESGSPAVGTTAEALGQYVTICGPGDQGCVITDVLDYAKAHGITVGGVVHKIDGYVAIDWTNTLEVQVALYLFGPVTLGLNLPQAWVNSPVWDVLPAGAPIAGGHDVPIVGYNAQGVQVASWGEVFTITYAALNSKTYVEEAYAVLSPDWYGNADLDPFGVDVAALQADLAKLGSGTLPDVGPTPTPAPVPVPTPTPTPVGPTVQQRVDTLFATLEAALRPYPFWHAKVVTLQQEVDAVLAASLKGHRLYVGTVWHAANFRSPFFGATNVAVTPLQIRALADAVLGFADLVANLTGDAALATAIEGLKALVDNLLPSGM